jgi:muramidase (phage lysozyme)
MNANRKAFLDAIAWAEGTAGLGDDGYNVIVTGIDGRLELFSDYSDHPFAGGRLSKLINNSGLRSSASGRYQFMLRDWEHYRRLLQLPDFGPESQDRWAIQLIKERRALADIDAGRFEVAVAKVRNIWASLPGAGYGQPERKLSRLRKAYVDAGGALIG